MAETGRRTVNQIDILEVDANPATSGQAAPLGSLALQGVGGAALYQKSGANDTDWLVIGAKTKAGQVNPALFSGNPKKRAVTFVVPFPSNTYSVSISGSDSRIFTVESITQNGFTINSNANAALTATVFWTAIFHGESA